MFTQDIKYVFKWKLLEKLFFHIFLFLCKYFYTTPVLLYLTAQKYNSKDTFNLM